MHQHHAMGLLAGLPHHIAVDGIRTGVPAHGVLGADVPVHPLPAALLYLGFQLRHQPLATVAAAYGVGAAAGKAQVPDALSVHIGRNALFQQGDVLPVGGAAAVDVAVFVGGRVQRDLMPGGSSLCEQGQIFLIVAGGHHKKGAVHPGGIQRSQHCRGGLAGAVIKGQADPFFRQGRGSGRTGIGCSHRRCGRGKGRKVRRGGQLVQLAAHRRACRHQPPRRKRCQRSRQQPAP